MDNRDISRGNAQGRAKVRGTKVSEGKMGGMVKRKVVSSVRELAALRVGEATFSGSVPRGVKDTARTRSGGSLGERQILRVKEIKGKAVKRVNPIASPGRIENMFSAITPTVDKQSQVTLKCTLG